MITKEPMQEAQIIKWIFDNKHIFLKMKCNVLSRNQFEQELKRALLTFRKYLNRQIIEKGRSMRIQKIGEIYSEKQTKKGKVLKLNYVPQILSNFAVVGQERVKQSCATSMDYKQISAISLLQQEFTQFAIEAYISACIENGKKQADRKVYLNLGVLKLCFFRNKVRLHQLKNEDNQNVNNRMYSKLKQQIDELCYQKWQQCREGAIFDTLNIRRLKQNFDKGASTMVRFNKLQLK